MLPQPTVPAVTAAQARALDAQAARVFAVPTRLLMENAGARCAELAWQLATRPGPRSQPKAPPHSPPRFEVCCGSGGNGGDGYVVARHLALAGARVRVTAVGVPRAGSDAADARKAWLALRVPGFRGVPTVVVDALLGTGLAGREDHPAAHAARPARGPDRATRDAARPARGPDGPALRCIRRMNALRKSGARVLAIDIPSGLDADTGAALTQAVSADVTATIAACKLGLTRPASRAFRGRVVVVPFGAPSRAASIADP